MNGSLIYDTLQTGTDNGALGAVVLLVVFVAGFIRFALIMRWGRKKGLPLKSESKRTAVLRNFVGTYSLPLIAAICVVTIGVVSMVFVHYQQDKRLIELGGYATWTGEIGRYTTLSISGRSRRGFDHIAGMQPTLHERDQMIVDGRVFVVECARPPDAYAGTVGEPGECLKVQTGRMVRVDYVQISPTQYRAEPLRIWLLDQ